MRNALLQSGMQFPEREQAVREMKQAETLQGFDLSCAPLFRTKLLRLAEEEYLLLVTFHHIVCDGASVGVLVREFALVYEVMTRGSAPALPASKYDWCKRPSRG